MQTSLRKMGNSTGMIVPKAILDQLGLVSGAKIDLRVENGEVIARPASQDVRKGWEEDAKRIGATELTREETLWLDADPGVHDDLPVPPEWLGEDA
jgi:antitoxin MazE